MFIQRKRTGPAVSKYRTGPRIKNVDAGKVRIHEGIPSIPLMENAKASLFQQIALYSRRELLAFAVLSLAALFLVSVAGCRDSGNAESALPTSSEQHLSSSPDLIEVAKLAMAREDFATAEAALRSRLLIDAHDSVALELSGDIAFQRGDVEVSILSYSEASRSTELPSHELMKKLAQGLMRAGRPFDAIDTLQRTIDLYPGDIQSRYDLAGVAASLGLVRPTPPVLRWLVQHGRSDQDSLAVLAEPDRFAPDREWCRKLLEKTPVDPKLEYSLACLDAVDLNWDAVTKRLTPFVDKHKDFLPAYMLYGRSLVERNDSRGMQTWVKSVPAGAEALPDYWALAGHWMQQQGKHPQAARAFWEGLRIDPTSHTETLASLMLSLNEIGRHEEATKVASQIVSHGALRDAIKVHYERKSRSQKAAMQVAESMLSLGRLWEAEAWARLATSLPDEKLNDLRSSYMTIRGKLSKESPWQLPDRMIGNQIDLSDLPRIDWSMAPQHQPESGTASASQFAFQDQAKSRGWVHTCKIAPEAETNGHWIYQSVGGGVGVIDFDLDGWPDLACAMLDGTPLNLDSSPNKLFRNVSGSFVEITKHVSYTDTGFSQGIAIGDFNEDGFPDIFDANIGQNRLYQNNGDGTFQDVTSQAGLIGNAWTSSVLIADINGDGFADLYEVNYCRGPEPFKVACRDHEGKISTCPPLRFEPELDCVWRGVGDGTFVNASSEWMQQVTPGRGLGVVAGTFDERPGLDLYIANDMSVNHLWSSDQQSGGFRLLELGAIRGLGFDAKSLSQASMGIACGDPDGDGDSDFFLTHFADDHNTYYEQVAPGFWSDRSNVVGLSEPSIKLLGFGTQWCDFDNNGTLELIVANGHVDRVNRPDISFKMPPQLFSREPTGRWLEHDRNSLGDYFAEDHLGRALAILDVDRDGLTDVAVTHLYDPVSLLVNQTKTGDAKISLELKATQGSRDAIGASVAMMIGDRRATAELTAGDGYMCSNQRRVEFGTGSQKLVQDLVVTWPSGAVEHFGMLDSDKTYLLVEGSKTAFLIEAR
jgi:tetratricopeptide (TPR) repeat protein